MSEIIFVVEEAPEGGYIARAVGESIFTEAQSLDDPPSPLISEFGAHAVLAMPLMARGRPIGAGFLLFHELVNISLDGSS